MLRVSGTALLDYFIISFLASGPPLPGQNREIRHAGRFYWPHTLSSGFPTATFLPKKFPPWSRQTYIYHLDLPIKMSKADTSQNSLETPLPMASSKSNNLWPKTASRSQQECSQACTVVVYDGGGSRHSGALTENSPGAVYPQTCHRPGTGETSQMLLHCDICKLPGEPLKSLNSSSRKDY